MEPNAKTGATPVDEDELLFHHSPVDEEDRNSSAVEEDDDENSSSAMLSVSPFQPLKRARTHVCSVGLGGSDLARREAQRAGRRGSRRRTDRYCRGQHLSLMMMLLQ